MYLYSLVAGLCLAMALWWFILFHDADCHRNRPTIYTITVFFGYTDKDQEGMWGWDGDDSDYKNWTRSGDWDLPDNGKDWGGGEWKNGGEDYAEYNYDRKTNWGAPNDITWNDATFIENTTIFFCEWDYDISEVEKAY